jgi:hypothetical protein
MRTRLALLALTSALLVSAQTPGGRIIKGAPAPPAAAAAKPSPEMALAAAVTLVKAPNGTWTCTGAAGKPCTTQEAQAYTTVTKSRSNVKDNLVIDPNGAVHCTAADGKPCSDVTIQNIATQMKAITKGGQLNF